MGHSASTASFGSSSSSSSLRRSKHSAAAAGKPSLPGDAPPMEGSGAVVASLMRDHTGDLPDECLAIVFQSLGSVDRKRCSLVCRRWLAVEAQSRYRLALNAQAGLLEAARALFDRYDSVTKLALKCDRRSDSIGDEALALIASRCPNLTRLKLRACRAVTDDGMAAVAKHCTGLRKLSVGSCAFGAMGVDAILRGCSQLEELSIKRLRGLPDAVSLASGASAAVFTESVGGSASLRSICMKELYNGQCFAPLIAGSPNLKTLKLIRCSGDWDIVLRDLAQKVPGVIEIHLEKLQVSDRGVAALAACLNLEVLHLVKTLDCTDIGLSAVAERCHLLRKIHIDGWKANRIGDEGLISIATQCPNLQELVLISVNPTARSLGLIASNCRNLERLALCGSETFGDNEITCIAAKCMALKKLCIKGCPISDQGMGALAEGCPNLIKLKVKKCRGVTPQCADWLMTIRDGMLAVSLDTAAQNEQEAGAAESQILPNGSEQVPLSVDQDWVIDVPTSSGARSEQAQWRTRVGFLAGRNFVASALRRWSHGTSNPNFNHTCSNHGSILSHL